MDGWMDSTHLQLGDGSLSNCDSVFAVKTLITLLHKRLWVSAGIGFIHLRSSIHTVVLIVDGWRDALVIRAELESREPLLYFLLCIFNLLLCMSDLSLCFCFSLSLWIDSLVSSSILSDSSVSLASSSLFFNRRRCRRALKGHVTYTHFSQMKMCLGETWLNDL